MAENFFTIPDIGNFDTVEVIEIHVNPGDSIKKDDSLITLESEKASMDIPSTVDGVVEKILLKVGDKVSKGDNVLSFKSATSSQDESKKTNANEESELKTTTKKPEAQLDSHDTYDLVVLGSGPGGYTAAFRAADLGLSVALVEKFSNIGGVCLNVGCIPSKALLHMAKVITEAEDASHHGITFGIPNIDLDKLRSWKNNDVVGKLTGGLTQMAKQRGVTVIQGYGKFLNKHTFVIEDKNQNTTNISFKSAIIAAGSKPIAIPNTPDHPNIIDSTGALEFTDIPKRMLIIGGGIIGLEMGTIYDALGTKITVVELTDGLMQGCDRDLVRPLQKRMEKRFEQIFLQTKVIKMSSDGDAIKVTFESKDGTFEDTYNKVLVSVGRTPNGKLIDAEKAGVSVDDRGFIAVDKQFKTNIPHIYAIGDIIGQPMLAHKATHEAKIAAEVIAGGKVEYQASVIPSVAYTDPEVAWVGITEISAKTDNLDIEKAVFPWAASGRALSNNRTEGLTKLIFDRNTKRLIGAGITGVNAGELIAEACLAIEMGADAQDIGLTIHPHPTLSESIAMASEVHEGTITDLFIRKR
ncbi:MAG: dihydrolipoyl dehydrogenase [Proteobacteria bacterium]|jgi:dihydrolipoamide dehydrogenase|nr:dihydrolipoyl dehydrogenase [Pseudomonadota bacterium]